MIKNFIQPAPGFKIRNLLEAKSLFLTIFSDADPGRGESGSSHGHIFFHLAIFCINLFEDIRLNNLRYTLYSYINKNLGNFMSYFFQSTTNIGLIRNKSRHIFPNFTHKNRESRTKSGKTTEISVIYSLFDNIIIQLTTELHNFLTTSY